MRLLGNTVSYKACPGGLILSALGAGLGRGIKKQCGDFNISPSQHLSN